MLAYYWTMLYYVFTFSIASIFSHNCTNCPLEFCKNFHFFKKIFIMVCYSLLYSICKICCCEMIMIRNDLLYMTFFVIYIFSQNFVKLNYLCSQAMGFFFLACIFICHIRIFWKWIQDIDSICVIMIDVEIMWALHLN